MGQDNEGHKILIVTTDDAFSNNNHYVVGMRRGLVIPWSLHEAIDDATVGPTARSLVDALQSDRPRKQIGATGNWCRVCREQSSIEGGRVHKPCNCRVPSLRYMHGSCLPVSSPTVCSGSESTPLCDICQWPFATVPSLRECTPLHFIQRAFYRMPCLYNELRIPLLFVYYIFSYCLSPCTFIRWLVPFRFHIFCNGDPLLFIHSGLALAARLWFEFPDGSLDVSALLSVIYIVHHLYLRNVFFGDLSEYPPVASVWGTICYRDRLPTQLKDDVLLLSTVMYPLYIMTVYYLHRRITATFPILTFMDVSTGGVLYATSSSVVLALVLQLVIIICQWIRHLFLKWPEWLASLPKEASDKLD